MTPDELAREWFERLWNQGDESTIDRLLAPHARVHGLGSGSMDGPDAFRPFFRQFRAAMPDVHVDVARTVTDGDTTVAHCHVTGTHTGPELGFAATGRSVDFWGFTMLRVEDGVLVEGWNCFDFLTCYQQLGVLPAM